MHRRQRHMLDYIVVCRHEFADRYGMNSKAAYKYLYECRGIALLQKFFHIERTLSFDDFTAPTFTKFEVPDDFLQMTDSRCSCFPVEPSIERVAFSSISNSLLGEEYA